MGLVLAALLVDLIGRRWIIVIGFLGAMGSTFVIAGLRVKALWPLAVAVGMQQLFQAWVWGPLDVLTGELFPTIVRNSGSGLLRTISGISGTISPIIGGAMVEATPMGNGVMWLYAVVYGIGVIPILLLNRDTKKAVLEDETGDVAQLKGKGKGQ